MGNEERGRKTRSNGEERMELKKAKRSKNMRNNTWKEVWEEEEKENEQVMWTVEGRVKKNEKKQKITVMMRLITGHPCTTRAQHHGPSVPFACLDLFRNQQARKTFINKRCAVLSVGAWFWEHFIIHRCDMRAITGWATDPNTNPVEWEHSSTTIKQIGRPLVVA